MKNLDKIRRLFKLDDSQNTFGYPEEELIKLEERLNIKLPQKLKSYYLTLGKNKAINYAHNRLLKPDTEIGFSTDNYLIFYEENQAVIYWGIKEAELQLDNPPVWGNFGTEEVPDWQLEGNTIEDFLLLMAIYNGTLGGLRYHAHQLDLVKPSLVEKIKNAWKEITEIS